MFCRKDVLRTCQLRQPGCTGSSVLRLPSELLPSLAPTLLPLPAVELTCT